MANETEVIYQATDTEFVITRVFDAPREVVFRAWTEAERLVKWWGPKGMKIGLSKLEVRPGGIFHYSMDVPNGDKWWGRFLYREILAPEKLVYISSFSDEEGNATRAPFTDKFPLEILNTITLTEEDGKTSLTLRGHPVNATIEEQQFFEGMFASMQQGFTGTLDQLKEYLERA